MGARQLHFQVFLTALQFVAVPRLDCPEIRLKVPLRSVHGIRAHSRSTHCCFLRKGPLGIVSRVISAASLVSTAGTLGSDQGSGGLGYRKRMQSGTL